MKRRFFVIGDTELGKGDLMDDFHDDDALVRFVEHAGNSKTDEVTLILNGDVFDFLKMDYEGKYPRYITEEISLWKMKRVIEAHPKVFEAWKKFVEKPHARLVFVIGNHDADVAWPKVQEFLCGVLGCEKAKARFSSAQEKASLKHQSGIARDSKIIFAHFYDEEHFHVQHGNLIDPFFGFNYRKPIISHKGKKILNLPLGAQITTQYLIPFKKKFHREEVLYPQHEVFKKHPEYKKAINGMMRRHVAKIFMIDPLVRMLNPMYRVPYLRILRHLFRNGFDGVHDDRFLDIDMLDTMFGKKQVFVLSHAHVLKDKKRRGVRYIFVDCWRTELNIMTPDLQKKPKTYVEIGLEGDKLAGAELKVFEV